MTNGEKIHQAGFAYGFNTAAFFPWLDPYERAELCVAQDAWREFQKDYEAGWIEGFELAVELIYAKQQEALTSRNREKQSSRVYKKVSH